LLDLIMPDDFSVRRWRFATCLMLQLNLLLLLEGHLVLRYKVLVRVSVLVDVAITSQYLVLNRLEVSLCYRFSLLQEPLLVNQANNLLVTTAYITPLVIF